MLYGLTDAQVNDPAWLAQDTDADGLSNQAELIAGTDPLRATSRLAVTTVTAGRHDRLASPSASVKGKLYTVESTTRFERSRQLGWLSPRACR